MNFYVIYQYRELLWNGFLVTIELSLLAICTGTMMGVLTGLLRTSRFRVLAYPVMVYTEIFRGSPLLMQLFMFYFGLPYIGVDISIFQATLLTYTLYAGAYIAEIIRSGIQSTPRGQFEAAYSLGLTYRQTMQKVILPQAMRVILPPLVGFYIGLIKDTSVASVIGYADMVKQGQTVMNMTDTPFEVYLVIALLFFIVCYPLSLAVGWMERRSKYS